MKGMIKRAIVVAGLGVLSVNLGAAADGILDRLRNEIAAGRIVCRLSEPQELFAVLGPPLERAERPEGGVIVQELKYPGFTVYLTKRKDKAVPFTLAAVVEGEKLLDIGRSRRLVLRGEADLEKMDPFTGLVNVSLARLDLHSKADLINLMNYDTETEWPAAGKLPEGFDPARFLETARTHALGVRSLQAQGIDGRGVGVAIIDQPLLLGHEEYAGRILRYDATGLDGFDPAMHGSAVASILVGRSLGVAPASSLTYFAVPMWEDENLAYVRALRRILELNRILPSSERIRVVSISDGAFAGQKHAVEWKEALNEVEASGIMVVTCDRSVFRYGTLTCVLGRDPDDPASYTPSRYASADDLLRLPAGNRTLASERGPNVFVLFREAGLSWGAPYIAGLAALAFQVNPDLTPDAIRQALVATARATPAGPIVDPAAFLSAVKKK